VSNFSRQQEKSLEEEIEEKKRFMPPHLHVSIETLDSVFLATSMFYEIPNMTQNKFNLNTKVQSRNFRRLIEQYDMKGIQFVPSSSRDFIVFASRNLHQSKWKEAIHNLSQIKVFHQMPEFISGSLKDKLAFKCKEVAIQIFLTENQDQYKSLKIEKLEGQFQLSHSQVLRIATKLIANGVLSAKINAKEGILVFTSNNPNGN
jgi:hypothetical protein